LNVGVLPRWPAAAFYLAPPRAWELLIGSLLALRLLPPLPSQAMRDVASLLGLGAIAFAVFGFDAATPFPGSNALFPCLGAALVIYAGQFHPSLVGRVLATRPLVITGLLSYSLYLWHWPIFVFAKYYLLRELTLTETLAAVVLTVALSIFSWRFVERPFRGKSGLFARPQLFAGAGVVMAAVSAFGIALHVSRGLPARFSPEVLQIDAAAEDQNPYRNRCLYLSSESIRAGRLCGVTIGSRDAATSFVVWGDSHADALMEGIGAAADRKKRNGIDASLAGCPPFIGVILFTMPSCRAFNDLVLATIKDDRLHEIILAARWANYAEESRFGAADSTTIPRMADTLSSATGSHAVFSAGFERTLAALAAAGKKVYVVLAVPEVGFDVPAALAREKALRIATNIAPTRAEFTTRQAFVTTAIAALKEKYQFEIIDPAQAFCDGSHCKVGEGLEIFYYDNHHLSVTGAKSISYLFDPIFANAKAAGEQAIESKH
jgi:hypothetical protein